MKDYNKTYILNSDTDTEELFIHSPRVSENNKSNQIQLNNKRRCQAALFCNCLAIVASNVSAQRRRKNLNKE